MAQLPDIHTHICTDGELLSASYCSLFESDPGVIHNLVVILAGGVLVDTVTALKHRQCVFAQTEGHLEQNTLAILRGGINKETSMEVCH